MGTVTGSDKARTYLARMGIATPWWVDAPPADAPAGSQPAAAPAPRRVRRLSDALDAAPAPAVPGAPAAAVPAPGVAAAQPAATAGTVPPFTLLAWGSEDGVLLLDSVGGQLAACPPERQQLAQDLLQAFSGKPARLSPPQCLCWPPRGRNQAVSLAEARDIVQGCIRRENERAPLGEVILLGDALPQWLGIDTGDTLLSSHFLPKLDARCLCLRGWPDGLDAGAKRALWRILAALGSRA